MENPTQAPLLDALVGLHVQIKPESNVNFKLLGRRHDEGYAWCGKGVPSQNCKACLGKALPSEESGRMGAKTLSSGSGLKKKGSICLVRLETLRVNISLPLQLFGQHFFLNPGNSVVRTTKIHHGFPFSFIIKICSIVLFDVLHVAHLCQNMQSQSKDFSQNRPCVCIYKTWAAVS